jgi:peptide-methionine (S)-S-oxide reductase
MNIHDTAVFGAGCFWGVQEAFEKVDGVESTQVGYSGGSTEDPTYEDVCSGTTGHAEVIKVEFDPAVVSYEELLDVFWSIHNPTQVNRQGPDVGEQYRSVIFVSSEDQKKYAQKSKEKLEKSGKYSDPIATAIEPAKDFYPAEDYHQHYFKKKGVSGVCHV